MGYVTENLLKGERVQHVGRVHWWAWGKGVALAVLGSTMLTAEAALMGVLLIAIGLAWALGGLITVMTTELAVTDRRVIAKFGLIRRSTVELLHSKVEGLSVDQGIFGRILGFGTIIVNGTGSGKTPIPHIAKPLEFRRGSLEIIENKQS